MESQIFKHIQEPKKLNIVNWICDHFIEVGKFNYSDILEYTDNTYSEYLEVHRKAIARCAYWVLGLYNTNCELRWRERYIQTCDDVDPLLWEDIEVFKQFWEWYYFELRMFVQNQDEMDLLIGKYMVHKGIIVPLPWQGFVPKSQHFYAKYCDAEK